MYLDLLAVVGAGDEDGRCRVVDARGDPVEDEEDRHDGVHDGEGLVAPPGQISIMRTMRVAYSDSHPTLYERVNETG